MLDSETTAVSAGIRVSDYRNCILSIIGSASANLKVFIKGAVSTKGAEYNEAPSFTVVQSQRNEDSNWDYIEVVDLEDGAAIDGDTGVDLNGNVIRLVEVNINSLDWLAVHSTGRIAGTVTVVGVFTTNQ